MGLGLATVVLVQMLVHYLSDSLQSAAGYLMFADKRIELGGHLRKLPMGYFTSGNIGKISSVLSTDMVFIAVSYTHLDVYKRQSFRWQHRRKEKAERPIGVGMDLEAG